MRPKMAKQKARANPGSRHHLAALYLLATSEVPEGLDVVTRRTIESHRATAETWLRDLLLSAIRRTCTLAGAARVLHCSQRTIWRLVARYNDLRDEVHAIRASGQAPDEHSQG
jgi:hypothetical protein